MMLVRLDQNKIK